MTPGLLLFALADAMLEERMWNARSEGRTGREMMERRARFGQCRALWWGTR